MQADTMDVDQADRSRRGAASGRVSWGRGTSSGSRSPYHRPPRPPSPTPKGNINARWGHELFDESSDIYSPRLARPIPRTQSPAPKPLSKFEPSPSLRPFGANVEPSVMDGLQVASPPIVVQHVPSSTIPQVPSPPPAPVAVGRPLAERLSIKGSALSSNRPLASAAPRQQQREPLVAKQAVSRSSVTALPPSPSEIRDQKAIQAKARDAYLKALKDWEMAPAILDIEHLADGTSVDDVRTAFSEHGTILGCEVVAGNVYQGQATLNAHITYSNRTSATRARDQFDGVIADGLQLIARLKPNPKPKLDTFVKAEEERANSSMDIEMLPAPTPPIPTPSFVSKMRSDQIPLDPRNSPQYAQLVSPPIVAEPAAKSGPLTAMPIAARISGGSTQSLKERLGNSRQNSSGSLLSRLKMG